MTSLVLCLASLTPAALAPGVSTGNLIFNANFSLGNVGFSSGYAYRAPAPNALFPERTYSVVANPARPIVLNDYGVADYFDHTTGRANGAFMMVNGSTDPDSLVWEQTATGLIAGRTYRFDVWVSCWTPNAVPRAKLALRVNDEEVATFDDPMKPGTWVQRGGRFVAHAATARLQIRGVSGWFYGNDFGLDDLSLHEVGGAVSRRDVPRS